MKRKSRLICHCTYMISLSNHVESYHGLACWRAALLCASILPFNHHREDNQHNNDGVHFVVWAQPRGRKSGTLDLTIEPYSSGLRRRRPRGGPLGPRRLRQTRSCGPQSSCLPCHGPATLDRSTLQASAGPSREMRKEDPAHNVLACVSPGLRCNPSYQWEAKQRTRVFYLTGKRDATWPLPRFA